MVPFTKNSLIKTTTDAKVLARLSPTRAIAQKTKY